MATKKKTGTKKATPAKKLSQIEAAHHVPGRMMNRTSRSVATVSLQIHSGYFPGVPGSNCSSLQNGEAGRPAWL
jgi:hypothetical protein